LQASQPVRELSQALLQQTPDTQNPEAQSLAPLQLTPIVALVWHVPFLQDEPAAQLMSLVQLAGQAVDTPSQSMSVPQAVPAGAGAQLPGLGASQRPHAPQLLELQQVLLTQVEK